MKHTIWTSFIDEDEWEDFLDEEGLKKGETESWERIVDINNEYLYDEIANCGVTVPNGLVVFADLGLWNGRREGANYDAGKNIGKLFTSFGDDDILDMEIYVEDGELKVDGYHHDGRNYYTIREWNAPNEADNLDDCHSLTDVFEKHTKPVGHYVCEVYGWEE